MAKVRARLGRRFGLRLTPRLAQARSNLELTALHLYQRVAVLLRTESPDTSPPEVRTAATELVGVTMTPPNETCAECQGHT